MTKALAKAPTTTGTSAPATAPFSSLQPVDYAKLENTIEQMYFQGKKVTPEQKAIFRHAVERTGLDPIVGQVRPVLRETKNGMQMAIQTSIDGYRLIADRTGVYAGSDEPVYAAPILKPFEHPVKATVTVWKFVQGQRCAFTASARWTEYFPQLDSQQFMWKKMPYLMLAKCAEALALRKAFPADLSGIYTDDEMQQAAVHREEKDETQVVPSTTPAAPKKAAGEPVRPTKTQVMEFLTSCKTEDGVNTVYASAQKYQWPYQEGRDISECMLNVLCRVKSWLRQGEFKLTDSSANVVASVVYSPKTGLATLQFPKQKKEAQPEPTEAEIADAERAGMKAA